jgi:hypothetical protein
MAGGESLCSLMAPWRIMALGATIAMGDNLLSPRGWGSALRFAHGQDERRESTDFIAPSVFASTNGARKIGRFRLPRLRRARQIGRLCNRRGWASPAPRVQRKR